MSLKKNTLQGVVKSIDVAMLRNKQKQRIRSYLKRDPATIDELFDGVFKHFLHCLGNKNITTFCIRCDPIKYAIVIDIGWLKFGSTPVKMEQTVRKLNTFLCNAGINSFRSNRYLINAQLSLTNWEYLRPELELLKIAGILKGEKFIEKWAKGKEEIDT